MKCLYDCFCETEVLWAIHVAKEQRSSQICDSSDKLLWSVLQCFVIAKFDIPLTKIGYDIRKGIIGSAPLRYQYIVPLYDVAVLLIPRNRIANFNSRKVSE